MGQEGWEGGLPFWLGTGQAEEQNVRCPCSAPRKASPAAIKAPCGEWESFPRVRRIDRPFTTVTLTHAESWHFLRPLSRGTCSPFMVFVPANPPLFSITFHPQQTASLMLRGQGQTSQPDQSARPVSRASQPTGNGSHIACSPGEPAQLRSSMWNLPRQNLKNITRIASMEKRKSELAAAI